MIGENASQQTLGKFDQNASQIESAEAIAAYLRNITDNKPEVISPKKIGSFNYRYILAFLITSNSNKIMEGRIRR